MRMRWIAAVFVFMSFASLSCTVPKSTNPPAHSGGADSSTAGQAQQPASAPTSVFDLRDGSHIVGTPLLTAVPLVSSYGSVSFRPTEVISIVATDSSSGVRVEFRNGDVLRGSLQVDSLPVQSTFGRINIPVSSILRMSLNVPESNVVEGLIAYYPLRGNTSDATGHGHDGTNYGAIPAPDRYGREAGAYSYDGGSARIGLPEGIVDPNCDACTLSLWALAKHSNVPRTALYIGAATAELDITYVEGKFAFGADLTTHKWYSVSTPAIENAYVHIAGVYVRGKSIKLYLNGEKKSEASVPDLSLLSGLEQYTSGIGSYAPEDPAVGRYVGMSNWFGSISDVRIYDRALRDEEIKSLAHSGDEMISESPSPR